MSPAELEAARAIVAHPRFRWLPGMRSVGDPGSTASLIGSTLGPVTQEALRVVAVQADRALVVCDNDGANEAEYVAIGVLQLPDLSDPATLGCLLALVREAWPDEYDIFVTPSTDDDGGYRVDSHEPKGNLNLGQPDQFLGEGETEALALCAALMAAPGAPHE